jgi:hypothetical protein
MEDSKGDTVTVKAEAEEWAVLLPEHSQGLGPGRWTLSGKVSGSEHDKAS